MHTAPHSSTPQREESNDGKRNRHLDIPQARESLLRLHGLSGVLTKPGPAVLFLDPASGAVVTITPTDTPHLLVLGEVGTATAQYLTDMAAGGYAAIATSRQMEVQ